MRHPLCTSWFLALLACCTACGGDEEPGAPSAPTSKEDQARTTLRTLFGHVRDGKPAEAAALIAYRGNADAARRWKAPYDYADADEKRAVDAVCSRIGRYLDAGAPTFEGFRSETESEGEWLVWHVRFGTGEGAPGAFFACIKNGDRPLLGDIDND